MVKSIPDTTSASSDVFFSALATIQTLSWPNRATGFALCRDVASEGCFSRFYAHYAYSSHPNLTWTDFPMAPHLHLRNPTRNIDDVYTHDTEERAASTPHIPTLFLYFSRSHTLTHTNTCARPQLCKTDDLIHIVLVLFEPVVFSDLC